MADAYHQVRLTDAAYGSGGRHGLAGAAQEAAGAGRGGDSFLVHVNAQELAEMHQRWGEPTRNPETGMPEFFLGGLRDWFKENPVASIALPVATSMLLPGLGSAVGGGINDALGLNLGATGQSALGGALVNGGLGALTGGTRGALIGGAVGAGMPFLQSGALGGGIASLVGGNQGYPTVAHGGVGPDIPAGQPGAAGSGGALSNLFGGGGEGGGSGLAKALPLIALAGMASGGGGSKSASADPAPSPEQQAAVAAQNRHLPQVDFTRKYTAPKGDLTHYGYGPEQTMFANNRLPQVPLARGGQPTRGGQPGALAMASQAPQRYVAGPGTGRSDKIPADLSPGEYVMDAETTALLGDGSSDAGGQILDQFRENVRKHKGKALSRGKISPNAKRPEAYLPKGAL